MLILLQLVPAVVQRQVSIFTYSALPVLLPLSEGGGMGGGGGGGDQVRLGVPGSIPT